MTIQIPETVFRGLPGGRGVVLSFSSEGVPTARLATASDAWEDIYAWTSAGYIYAGDGPYTDVSTKIATVPNPNREVLGGIPLKNDTYYDLGSDHVMYYSTSKHRMSLEKGTDGKQIGIVHYIGPRYATRTNQTRDSSLLYNNGSPTDPSDPLTVNLDDTLELDDEDRPAGFGDRRIVVCYDRGAWSSDETLTVQGGGATLATLDQRSAIMFELTNAVKNEDETWTTTWSQVTGDYLFTASVSADPGFWRQQMIRATDQRVHPLAHIVATTTGEKSDWTVSTTAPTGTRDAGSGWLVVGGLENNTVFGISSRENDGASTGPWDPIQVVKQGTDTTYTLLDGNCNVIVSSKGIRVNHVASGDANYSVDTRIWMIEA